MLLLYIVAVYKSERYLLCNLLIFRKCIDTVSEICYDHNNDTMSECKMTIRK